MPDQGSGRRREIVCLLTCVGDVDPGRTDGRRALVPVRDRSGPEKLSGVLVDSVKGAARAGAAHIHHSPAGAGSRRKHVLPGLLQGLGPLKDAGRGIVRGEGAGEVDVEDEAVVVGNALTNALEVHGSPEQVAIRGVERIEARVAGIAVRSRHKHPIADNEWIRHGTREVFAPLLDDVVGQRLVGLVAVVSRVDLVCHRDGLRCVGSCLDRWGLLHQKGESTDEEDKSTRYREKAVHARWCRHRRGCGLRGAVSASEPKTERCSRHDLCNPLWSAQRVRSSISLLRPSR